MRGCRECMVVVVPRLAERRQGEPCEVARLISRREAPSAEEVAQRVDREGGVVQEEDAYSAAPEHARQAADDGAGERDSEPEWECEAQQDPERKRAIDRSDQRVREQVLGIALLAGTVDATEHPTDMGMKQTPERPSP